MVNFVDSQYKFTNPIRFFKANDPIYFEVDNIPLKQLQENDLWLKDQLGNVSSFNSVGRSGFTELQPYTDGVDNVIKVRPGRFTARINDAYQLEPLQVISRLTGNSVSADDFNSWIAQSVTSDSDLNQIIDKFKQEVALNLNGLVERNFTWPAKLPDVAASEYFSTSAPKIAFINVGPDPNSNQPAYPGIGATLWGNFTGGYTVKQFDNSDGLLAGTSIGFARMPAAETAFIKKWRGVARTAVVDIPSELSIEIPPFDDEDFFYYDEDGSKNYFDEATHRIDLLFIYSKPIDQESVTVDKFVNNSPTTINSPQLGIIYGAGIGMNFRTLSSKVNKILGPVGAGSVNDILATIQDSTLPDGTKKILAHFGDQAGINTGFSNVKGSFPSPDDLMNLSPLLDEELNSDSFALIGQTALPIAYIVVKKSASRNSVGSNIITSDDVIDIRPFFRTTELSYNERAGIAAAVPSISIANPVASQAELNFEVMKLRQDILNKIPSLGDNQGPASFRNIFYTQIPYQSIYDGHYIPPPYTTNDLTRRTPILSPVYSHEFRGYSPQNPRTFPLPATIGRLTQVHELYPYRYKYYPLNIEMQLDIFARDRYTCRSPISVYAQIYGENTRPNDIFIKRNWFRIGTWNGGESRLPQLESFKFQLDFLPFNNPEVEYPEPDSLIPIYTKAHQPPFTLSLYLCKELLIHPEPIDPQRGGPTELRLDPAAFPDDRFPIDQQYIENRGADNPLFAISLLKINYGYTIGAPVYLDSSRLSF